MAGAAVGYIASEVVGSALIAEGVGAAIGTELFMGGVVGGLVAADAAGAAIIGLGSTLIGHAVGGLVNSALADSPSQATSPITSARASGRLINDQSNVEPIPVVYGKRRVGGARVFLETTGAMHEYLHLVVALCEGPINDIPTVYIDGTPSTDAKFKGLVDIYKHLGSPTQTVDTALSAAVAKWDANHRLQGVAYLYLRITYSDTAFRSIPVISADVEGRTLYDTRDTATRYSNNPALVIRDYLTNTLYGRGLDTSQIDDASISAAATFCDQTISMPAVNYTLTCNTIAAPVTTLTVVPKLKSTSANFFQYAVTYYDAHGETEASPLCTTSPEYGATTYAGTNVSGIPIGPPQVIGRKLYRTDYAGGQLKLVTTIANNTATTFSDTVLRSVVAANPNVPVTNTTQTRSLSITEVSSNFTTGDAVTVASSGTLPAPLAAATVYYIVRSTSTEVFLATSLANAKAGVLIDITSSGSGALTIQKANVNTRYTCDGVVNTSQTAYDNLQRLLTSCRGMLIYAGGKYRLTIDKLEAATGFVFNEDNITGAWKITPGGKRTRFNRITAGFFNDEKDWQPDLVTVDSASLRAEDNALLLETKIDLEFTLNPIRVQYIAQQSMNQSRFGLVVEFTAFQSGLLCEVGDVVQITHSTPGWTAKKFRILEIEITSTDEVNVVSREYDDSVYTINLVSPLPPATASAAVVATTPPAPTGLSLTYDDAATVMSQDMVLVSNIVVTWDTPPDQMVLFGGHAEVQFKLTNDFAWQTAGLITGNVTTLSIAGVVNLNYYDIRVRFRNNLGVWGPYTASTAWYYNINAARFIAAPATVENLLAFYLDKNLNLSWSPVSDFRPIIYEVRKGSVYGSAPVIARTTATEIAVEGNDNYWVVALAYGLYYGAPALEIVTGSRLVDNVFATIDQRAGGWAGEKTDNLMNYLGMYDRFNGSLVIGGSTNISYIPVFSDMTSMVFNLPLGGVATYTIPETDNIDMDGVYPVNIWVDYAFRAENIIDLISGIPLVSAMDSFAGNFGGYSSCVPQMAMAGADGAYGEWADFVPGQYVGQHFKFRVQMASTHQKVAGVLDQFTPRVDVPDRILKGRDNILAGGSTITYGVPFHDVAPNLQIAINNASQGDTIFLTAPDPNGFTVQVKNAGVGQARSIDWIAQGY